MAVQGIEKTASGVRGLDEILNGDLSREEKIVVGLDLKTQE
ncbi:MAG: hypothetical protein ACLFT2_06705 [Candidatus Brocadiia bacterium]